MSTELLLPSPQTPTCPVFIELNNGKMFGVEQIQIDRWSGAHPAVDVLTELRRLAVWCHANKSRRKTRRGIEAAIVTWLGRAQDRGGFGPPGQQQGIRARADEEYFASLRGRPGVAA